MTNLVQENEQDYILTGDSVWITVKDISIHIVAGDEGVSVSLYPVNFEDGDSLTETWATYAEARQEEVE